VPRHAASLIVWRKGGGEPEILMGMRHAKHKFMPSVLVFPGGRVDRADHGVKALSSCGRRRRRCSATAPSLPRPRARRRRGAGAASRRPGCCSASCRAGGCCRPRRARLSLPRGDAADARHALQRALPAAPAERVRGEIGGSGELEKLGWYPLSQALASELADITRKILGEFGEWLQAPEGQRHLRPKIVYQGNDNRMSDE
jgi:8-oxo-dGTP pyrophosphatase MutT (NUDIX family)